MRRRDPSTVPDDSAYWRELSHENWLALARKQSARFWSKIDCAGTCWLWLPKRVDKDGYGRFAVTGRGARCFGDKPKQKYFYAHRLSWELQNGSAPVGSLMLHSCDTPRCCNPAHLSPGTQKENLRQASERGRIARGERNCKAVVTEAQVRTIRDLAATGLKKIDVARRLGVSRAIVYTVLSRKTWRHVA